MAKHLYDDSSSFIHDDLLEVDKVCKSDEKRYKEIKDVFGPPSDDIVDSCIHGINGDSHLEESLHEVNYVAQRDINVTCPTCRGTGTICADDSSLLALIPVKDKRLKPKRIKLKIAIAIFITLVLCGITVYFLFPRSPSLELVSVISYNVSFRQKEDPFIVIKSLYRVKNDNFVTIKLALVSVDVTCGIFEVGGPKSMQTFNKRTVDARSSTTFSIYVNTTYSDDNIKNSMRFWCKYQGISVIYLKIATVLQSSFMFHDEQISSNDIKQVSCYYNSTAL